MNTEQKHNGAVKVLFANENGFLLIAALKPRLASVAAFP